MQDVTVQRMARIVQPGRNSYHVSVQFVLEDEQGQVIADARGIGSAKISTAGKLIEFVNGQ